MSGRFTRSWCEAGAQTPPLLRASSPLKPKNQPRTNIENWYSERGHFKKSSKRSARVITIVILFCFLKMSVPLTDRFVDWKNWCSVTTRCSERIKLDTYLTSRHWGLRSGSKF